jgi:hypothetical protein
VGEALALDIDEDAADEVGHGPVVLDDQDGHGIVGEIAHEAPAS